MNQQGKLVADANANSVEEWRDICGYEGLYQVSNWGRVRSLSRVVNRKGQSPCHIDGMIKSTPINPRWGYVQVTLHSDGVPHTYRLHKLVAAAFIGERPGDLDINHKDGNKTNNAASNLEYCTRSENVLHALDTGLSNRRGEGHPLAKLSKQDVDDIRAAYRNGVLGKDLAVRYGVARSQISRIVNLKRRKMQ